MVTGASGGIGRAIAVGLARSGVGLCAVGRNSQRLAETAATASRFAPVHSVELDLADERALLSLTEHLRLRAGRLDYLIHAAGVFRQGVLEEASTQDLDLQHAVNVRAPFLLTRNLLPLLADAGGQIVFINSSTGLSAMRAGIAQYAATKHALKALADGVRAEVNPMGIRVLSVFLGRTATAMQEEIFREEGREYHPERLLQPADVAAIVLAALALPRTAEVTDISIRPMLST